MPSTVEIWSMLDQPLRLLSVLVAVNSAPILGKWALGRRWSWPLDANTRFIDGRPLFGSAKTIRGITAGVGAGLLCAPLLGMSIATGVSIALLSLTGDLLSSFVKRRLALAPGSRAWFLDQIPEALLPLLALREALAISWPAVAGVTIGFLAIDLVLSRPLHRMGVRDRPH